MRKMFFSMLPLVILFNICFGTVNLGDVKYSDVIETTLFRSAVVTGKLVKLTANIIVRLYLFSFFSKFLTYE